MPVADYGDYGINLCHGPLMPYGGAWPPRKSERAADRVIAGSVQWYLGNQKRERASTTIL